MRVGKIIVSGFRSLAKETTIIDLNKINVFVGKNNQGKTNALEIFRLLQGLTKNEPIEKVYRPFSDFCSVGKQLLSLSIEFLLDDEEREKSIQLLFQGNTLVESVDLIKSQFLRTIRHRLVLNREGKEEETVEIQNVNEGYVTVRKAHRDAKKRLVVEDGELRAACTQLKQAENVSLTLKEKTQVVGAFWKVLEPPADTEVVPSLIVEFYANLDWTPPIRLAQPRLDSMEVRRLNPDGSNLPQVWNTIVSEDTRTLVKISDELKKTTDIADVQAPIRGNQALANMKESDGLVFDLRNTSSGNNQLAILVTKIVTLPRGTMLMIEEPELHLHASAQRNLRAIMESYCDNHQFLMTTHSTIFANMTQNTSLYLVTKKGMQSTFRQVKEPDDLRFVKWELGHNNADIYGFNLVVFVEGESETVALPIMSETLGHDFAQNGIKLLNIKGSGKVKKLEQYLEYLKDSDTAPFVVADGNKDVSKKIQDWIGSPRLLPQKNFQVWEREFEDLFPVELITGSLIELGYREITSEKLNKEKGNLSIVHAIRKILYETGQNELDKPALAETIAKKMSRIKMPVAIIDLIARILNAAGVTVNREELMTIPDHELPKDMLEEKKKISERASTPPRVFRDNDGNVKITYTET